MLKVNEGWTWNIYDETYDFYEPVKHFLSEDCYKNLLIKTAKKIISEH